MSAFALGFLLGALGVLFAGVAALIAAVWLALRK